MKICVYAIAKNESQFVKRWVESMKEADELYVLDTGSDDDTASLLEEMGVHVKINKITPWRFDVARNASLDMVPKDADICVCTDLDEVFDPGWRDILEKTFNKSDRASYEYVWSFDEYGNPAVNFYQEKIHTRNNYTWINPVHEVLKFTGQNEKRTVIPKIILKHYPDNTKSRSNYLPLLELAVKEDPNNDRNMHYLGREYMFNRQYDNAIETLKNHLALPSATWKEERSASMRFISRCYLGKSNYEEAIRYCLLAIAETPNIREPYVELAFIYNDLKEYQKSLNYLQLALDIKENQKVYINEPCCYDGTIEDLLSTCYSSIGNMKEALKYVKIALEKKPNEERIKNNLEMINNMQE